MKIWIIYKNLKYIIKIKYLILFKKMEGDKIEKGFFKVSKKDMI